MLTPQEVSERAFQRANFGGGYNMAQVDEFLDVLTQDYSSLYNENAVLKNKMKVLVDKVEEYRTTEDAMRKALMTAQRMADDLLKEAEEQKKQIIKDAEAEAITRRDELIRGIEAEEYRLQVAQQATADFVEKVLALQAEESQLLANLRDLVPGGENAAPEDPVDQAASEIDDNVQRLLAKAMQESSASETPQEERPDPQDAMQDTGSFVPVAEETEAPAQSPTPVNKGRRRIEFGKLQFGRDYEVK